MMDKPGSPSLEGLDITVTETPDAVTYSFTPHGGWRPAFPSISVVLFVVLPVAILGMISYAYDSTRGTRPEWELVLTGLFAVQLGVWGGVGMGFVWRAFSKWWMYRHGTTLVFRGQQVLHAGEVACELADVRGLRMFVYPEVIADSADTPPHTDAPPLSPDNRPALKQLAALSLLIGEERYTHGLLAGFEPVALRRLADDIHRRLVAFRHNQGVMGSLLPIDVVETTPEEAESKQHTRPSANRTRLSIALINFGMLAFTNPVVSTVWCVSMFAGLFASGRLVLASGLGMAFLAGHVVLVFLHVTFLAGAWGTFGPIGPPTESEK